MILKKKNWFKVLKNIAKFYHNSAENDDFDDGRIRKSKMPVRNLLHNNNSLPQDFDDGQI